MNHERESLLHLIGKFYHLLETTDDSKDSFREFLGFIKLLLRTKFDEYIIPSIEMVSLIKARKPFVFHQLRLLAEKDVNISILVGSTISEEKAEQRLESLVEQLEKESNSIKKMSMT